VHRIVESLEEPEEYVCKEETVEEIAVNDRNSIHVRRWTQWSFEHLR